jgi:hypothetical protein
MGDLCVSQRITLLSQSLTALSRAAFCCQVAEWPAIATERAVLFSQSLTYLPLQLRSAVMLHNGHAAIVACLAATERAILLSQSLTELHSAVALQACNLASRPSLIVAARGRAALASNESCYSVATRWRHHSLRVRGLGGVLKLLKPCCAVLHAA